MREGIQSLGQRERLLGPDRLTEALRGKIRAARVSQRQARTMDQHWIGSAGH
jgi:hypothetical protein